MTRRVAIVGSRYWKKPIAVRNFVYRLPLDVVVVTGDAPEGVDVEVAIACRIDGRLPVIHKAEWRTYGPIAGPRRNTQIVNDCTEVHAFLALCPKHTSAAACPWKGWSHGTSDTIKKAQDAGKPVTIYHEEDFS